MRLSVDMWARLIYNIVISHKYFQPCSHHEPTRDELTQHGRGCAIRCSPEICERIAAHQRFQYVSSDDAAVSDVGSSSRSWIQR